MQTVDAIAIKFFDMFPKLGKISDTLHIRYINQFTGKEIKLYKFNYDEQEIAEGAGVRAQVLERRERIACLCPEKRNGNATTVSSSERNARSGGRKRD